MAIQTHSATRGSVRISIAEVPSAKQTGAKVRTFSIANDELNRIRPSNMAPGTRTRAETRLAPASRALRTRAAPVEAEGTARWRGRHDELELVFRVAAVTRSRAAASLAGFCWRRVSGPCDGRGRMEWETSRTFIGPQLVFRRKDGWRLEYTAGSHGGDYRDAKRAQSVASGY